MAGFVSRLVACLVAVVAVLQLVHLVLLNKLESTRLHELRRLQQQQQYHQLQQHHTQQQNGDSAPFQTFQETALLQSDNTNQIPHHSRNIYGYSSNHKNIQDQQQWGNWRPERSASGGVSPDVPEQEIHFDHLLREDQGAIVDSTGEFRIVFDVAGPRSGSQPGNPHSAPAVIEKEAMIIPGTNAQTDDFSIDDENFEGLAPSVDLSLVTFGNFQDVTHLLIPLVSRWNAPISLAIFAPNSNDVEHVLEFISQARLCHGPTRQYVSFHLVFPLVETHSRGSTNNNNGSKATPSQIRTQQYQQQKRLNFNSSSSSSSNLPVDVLEKSCQSFRDQINKYYQSANGGGGGGGESRKYSKGGHNIPANLLRNVARRRVTTDYSFAINIDMIPSRNLRASFQQFVRDRIASSGDEKKTVFVLPAFEIKYEEQIPQVKAELLHLVDKHKARPFQFDLCWKCQMYTDYETWQRDRNSKNGKMRILFEVLWKDPWEPFFISDNSIPLFDERFRYAGVNRMSQLCELHVAGYKFAVLSDAFLVHRGYVTTSKNQEERSRDIDSSRAHFRQFKTELKDKYPHSTRRCY
ncbi:unnamed protein product [Orchesella dallaii]|uniref:Beta-1,4-glucuronyltransferase 1 n=1 Tax=Orchesella dallaii TaxID=48710 RepID=A0ABP1QF35_9HEXA